jgi:hypothetical protein
MVKVQQKYQVALEVSMDQPCFSVFVAIYQVVKNKASVRLPF